MITMKEARQRLGLTQAELGHELGVNKQTISNVERGAYTYSAGMRARVTLLLIDGEIEKLIFGEGDVLNLAELIKEGLGK
jgi:transcriptional regulator with XRE-family HTH domain